ncbi:MAG: hypothetical protein AUH86_13985 [Acidobacteria bacterium 13_1_40CM_4_58_4]|nr:MAG: hypothetical protein AUH86_13985 [Acidobacteria bacterium 13_1_40CM_4_58_4]
MKKTGIAFALLAVVLMTCAGTHAQMPSPKGTTVKSAPDLSKLNIEKVLQQLQATTVQPSNEETSPLQVVAEFLQLSPGQVTELEQLLQARQAKLMPLFQTAQTLIQQLGNLLNSGGNPEQVGAVVIQIHALQQQMAQAQQAFLTQFTAILSAEQLQKLRAVQVAAQLQPILPAFQPIFLF